VTHRRSLIALLLLNLLAGTWSLAVDGVTPSWIVYPLLLLLTLPLLRRSVRHAAGYLAAVATLFVLVHLGFLGAATSETCVHPADSSIACHRATWMVTLGVVPMVTAVGAAAVWFRARPGQPSPLAT
jgi:hypothetical protein